jgi:hypothetical protein
MSESGGYPLPSLPVRLQIGLQRPRPASGLLDPNPLSGAARDLTAPAPWDKRETGPHAQG